MDVTTKTFDQVQREFEALEFELEIKIKEILDKIHKNVTETRQNHEYSMEIVEWQKSNREALARNANLIKDLEFKKAKLRSQYYFQPATNHFDNEIKKFKTYRKSKSER